ncbi:MAG TPA: ATP-binding cassette domain-containing protein [Ramlibacter sp.]|uniref:branched-chain amino acid ABC transporter ATP-binding protein/permease n=1 Tax=Ramlibacter sp. TaxID=1917967 RepID=UPI002C65F60E|nr:ATP-binding cassette domain-containing protein [Ramlibacter sp.]HVZ45506.1 ATP-binding cassette domain-containing protein [Ramlibacter sp.]
MTIAVALASLGVLVPDALHLDYWTLSFQLVNLLAVAALCQNLLLADAGQVSFGQGAVFGVAAYCTGIAVGLHALPYLYAACLGTLAACGLGILFALPALRVQHYYLGFVTLSGALVFPQLVTALNEYTNGIGGITIQAASRRNDRIWGLVSPLSVAVLALTIASFLAYEWIRRRPLGRAMRVAAFSPEAAQSLGISPGRMRFVAFIIAAAGTGLAGSLYPAVIGFVSPQAFGMDMSVLFFMSVIIGGRTSVLGPLLGVAMLYLVPNMLLAGLVEYRLLIYGAIAFVAMYAFPEGIVGAWAHWRLQLRPSRTLANAGPGSILDVPILPRRDPWVQPGRPAIEVQGACLSFGSVVALDGVDLEVRRGEIHALIGSNGSGKTSLLNALSGFNAIDSGMIRTAGVDISCLRPHLIAGLGVGRTFQTPRIVPNLSVQENLMLGQDAARALGREHDEGLASPLTDGPQNADWLSHGERRLAEVVRVILQGADILLMDEPAAGLSPAERAAFATLLMRLKNERGTTVVLVEHDLRFVWGIADRITVLESGRVIASGTASAMAAHPVVAKMFVGDKHVPD